MYSVVLAAAMMTAPVAPDFGGRHRGGGCSGCYGGGGRGGFLGLGILFPSSNRYGSGCMGCSGSYSRSSCYGSNSMSCYGSYPMSGYGSYSMSCYGSYATSGYGGCYGSSYGYAGDYAEAAAIPSYPMAMAPTFGGDMPSHPMAMGPAFGGEMASPPMAMGPSLGATPMPTFQPPMAGPNLGGNEPPLAIPQPDFGITPAPNAVRPSELLPPMNLNADANFATVVVTLPADARLFVENQEWTSELGQMTRTFRTPALDPGRLYLYAFRIEVPRGGRTVPLNQEVTLQAGKTARVTFADPGATTSRTVTASFAVMQNER